MLRAVLFDLDGLLIDSEPLWVRAEIEVFGAVGVVLTEDDCAKTKGLRTDDVIAYWHTRRPWSGVSPRAIELGLIETVAALVKREGQALPGVQAAVAAAREQGRKLALASSSPLTIIEAALDALDLRGAFDVVQSAETEPLGKPHPGIFLRAADRLEVAPTASLVLEDSVTGLIAAKAARMACIAVPAAFPPDDARFALADDVVASLAEVTADRIAGLAKRLKG